MFSSSSFTNEQTHAVSLPLPTTTRSPSTSTNPIDDFFGSTRASRHDRRISASSAVDGEALPSYQDVEALPLPSYSQRGNKEPVTLAMYLFKFGFLFPPFWILGALILISDLRTPEAPSSQDSEHLAWLPDKTAAEREAIVQHIRVTEVKWAKRCLFALAVLSALLLIGGLAIWAVLRR